MRIDRRFPAAYLSFLLLAISGAIFAGQAYRSAKGVIAGLLIERAFAAHLEDGEAHPPWAWADMHPLAEIEIPSLGIRRIVLAGATGESMAFAAGWLNGTSAPNGPGNCVLAGHRDRAFAFLERLRPGDSLLLTARRGTREWIVAGASVVSRLDSRVTERSAEDRLSLVTCYPFDSIVPSDQRYVILCAPAGAPAGAPVGDPAREVSF